jgi:hypothetical protein
VKTFIAIAIVLSVTSCKKKHDDAPAPAGSAAAAPANPPSAPASGPGVTITDTAVPDFSGSYDKVFAQLRNDDNQTVVAFVRGCPSLTCTPGPWEPEQVSHTCPKAYIATVTIGGFTPDRYHVDMKIAGPADSAATATIEHVKVELTDVGNDGVAGSVSIENTDASVSGTFKAEVCPRT